MRNAAIAVICLAAASCAAPRGSEADAVAARIGRTENGLMLTQSIESRMARYQVPGLSIAVVNNFELEWAKGYGTAEEGSGRAVTPETLFQAASISKVVNSVLVMQQVERGALDLDQHVNERLASWQLPENEFTQDEKVTLRRLLSHTAGTTVGGFPGYARDAPLPNTAQILDGLEPANTEPIRVDTVPGTLWRYSGGGTTIVEQLLVDTAGMAYVDLARSMVLEPTGMTDSTFAQPLPEHLHNRAATAHGEEPITGVLTGRQPYTGKWHVQPEHAAAGLWTTPSDLGRFAIEAMRARRGKPNALMNQRTATTWLTPQWESLPDAAGMDMDIALGPMLLHLGPYTVFMHAGSNMPGYRCFLVALPEQGFAIAVMTNGAQGMTLCYEIVFSALMAYGILPSHGQVILFFCAMAVVASGLIVGPLLLLKRLLQGPIDPKDASTPQKEIATPAVIMGALGVIVTLVGSVVSLAIFAVPSSAESMGDLRHLAIATAAGSIGLLTMALALLHRRAWALPVRLYYLTIAIAAMICTMNALALRMWPLG